MGYECKMKRWRMRLRYVAYNLIIVQPYNPKPQNLITVQPQNPITR